MGLVLGQALRTALVGIAVGTVGALGLTRLLRAELYGVGAVDPLTFFVAPGILLLTTLAAAFLPAWRASCVDPIVALKHEA
jgi:putative ABC transport system permease protein